jgi:hypothetical protein
MWVRFWYKIRCSTSSSTKPESQYRWVSERETDESLEEWARELIPSWLAHSIVDYGFERVTELPEDVRQKLLNEHQAQIKYHQEMVDILNGK